LNRERKTREERIREIWDGAKKAILEKGYEETTIEDIIAKTELSKGGFYHYYNSKKQILIDLMKNGNIMYMRYNSYMNRLKDQLSRQEKKQILIDAMMDKMLVPTDDKTLFAVFLTQILSDSECWEVYIELEKEFLIWMAQKLEISYDEKRTKLEFLSRTMNGILCTQHIFYETDLFIHNRAEFVRFYEPIIDEILM